MRSYVATGLPGDTSMKIGPHGNKTKKPTPLETIRMRILKRSGALALTLAAALMSSGAWADNASPVGLWRNVDDVSGKPRALIRVTESNGTLQGKIEKVFPAPSEDRNPKCEKCEGALKNVPVIGLVILSGLKKDGTEYTAGKILDPDNGKVYSSKIQLTDGGFGRGIRLSALPASTQSWRTHPRSTP
jgi:uncharacterized protein (DUF2147 family)